MRELYLDNMEHFKYELNAFLFTVRSVPNILLEDFNKIFALGINSETELNPSIFEKNAYQINNIQALTFLLWWTRFKNINIISDPLFSMLFRERNITIQGKLIEYDNLDETHVFISGEWKVYDEEGNLVTQTSEKPVLNKNGWFFTDYLDTNALESCENLFYRLKKFIEEAKNQFM